VIRKSFAALALVALGFTAAPMRAEDKVEEGFKVIFDGKSLDGWKINEKKETWTLKDGALIAKGDRSHIFYIGDDKPFKNFELKVDCKTEKNSNGGIYFHTKFQDDNWPKYGFEAQVNNTNSDPRRSGSLYAVSDVKEQHIQDNEWWTETVRVEGKHITIKLNDKVVVDYEEPADKQAGDDFTRKIDSGTFALQGHDPGSTVYYKNIRVKRLPD
jgi:hypothetical protein